MSTQLDSLLTPDQLADCCAADARELTRQQFAGVPIPIDAWAGIIARATVYRARCGRRVAFQSESDALAYEKGWSNWPDIPPRVDCPEGMGWAHREMHEVDREDQRMFEAQERLL